MLFVPIILEYFYMFSFSVYATFVLWLSSVKQVAFLQRELNLSKHAFSTCSKSESSSASTSFPVADGCDSDILLGSDEELLLESDDDVPELLLETDSEDEADGAGAGGKPRTYANRRSEAATFLGKPVCMHAYQRLLGVGSSTIEKIRNGEDAFTMKSQAKAPKHPMFGFSLDKLGKWVAIVLFFWMLYHSCAETLPTTFNMPRAKSEAPFMSPDDEDYSFRVVNKFMMGLNVYCNDPDVHNIGPGTFSGSKRHLQHTTRTELYFEYVASCRAKGEAEASYSQFMRVANKIIGPHSRFSYLGLRKTCEHAQCNYCFEFKRAIRHASGSEAKGEAYRKYSHHILSQWLDRQIYWQFRAVSQSYFRQVLQLGSRLSYQTPTY